VSDRIDADQLTELWQFKTGKGEDSIDGAPARRTPFASIVSATSSPATRSPSARLRRTARMAEVVHASVPSAAMRLVNQPIPATAATTRPQASSAPAATLTTAMPEFQRPTESTFTRSMRAVYSRSATSASTSSRTAEGPGREQPIHSPPDGAAYCR
jgi:hypothetical protein